MVEIQSALALLTLLAMGTFGVMLQSLALDATNRENAVATAVVRQVIEEMQQRPFEDLVTLYNDDPSDDPEGPGTAPGPRFGVLGLGVTDPTAPVVSAPIVPRAVDGVSVDLVGSSLIHRVVGDGEGEGRGEIILPTVAGVGVREDSVNPALGLPRDLNGDGAIDSDDHAQDYLLLPVTVRLTWRGPGGPRVLDVHTVLSSH
jgi:hypothetical protein